MNFTCTSCGGPSNRPSGGGWTCRCGLAWHGPSALWPAEEARRNGRPLLTTMLDALAQECQTLRGLVASTPRRWWRPAMGINLAPPRATPRRWAFLRAFWRVRRDVWDAREARLRAKWEGYG